MGHCSDHGDWRRTPCHPGVEPEPFTSAEGRGAWVPRAAGEAAAVPAPGADSRTPRPPDTGSWCHRATAPAARHKFSLTPPPCGLPTRHRCGRRDVRGRACPEPPSREVKLGVQASSPILKSGCLSLSSWEDAFSLPSALIGPLRGRTCRGPCPESHTSL